MRHAIVALSACLVAFAAPAQDGSPRKLRNAFRDDTASEKAYESRRAAIAAASASDDARIAAALIDVYVSLEREADELAERRRKFLLRGGGSRLLGPLRYRLQPVRNLQDQVLDALGGMRAPATLREMVTHVLRMKSPMPWTLRIAIAERTGELPDDGLAWLEDTPDSARDEAGVLVALRAIAPLGRRAESATEWVVARLADKSDAVRIEAARTLAQLAVGVAIAPLIERIEVERDRVREAVLDALVVLTGHHPGNTAAAWRLWLEREGAPYVSGARPLGRGDASKRDRKRDQDTTAGSYFGIDQTGESILYVFDVSQSMRNKMASVDGGEKITRWERCHAELVKALDGLTIDQRFNLVGFANELPIFAETMQDATPKNIERAKQWLAELKLQFQTNIFDALELSFALAGRGVKDHYYECEADTIFFLSDGAPTIPNRAKPAQIAQDDPGQILSAVRRWNALGRVVIHTVGLALPKAGEKPARNRAKQFMRELAEQNGGRFVEAN